MPLTADRPKCMVEVAGTAIVDTILRALAGLGVEEIVVVTGYKAQALEDYLRALGGFRWRFVHNDRFQTTNNILSLQVAAPHLQAPFVLVESDIYLDPEVLAPLAQQDTILVAPYTDAMDGTGIVMDAQNRVREMVIRAHLHRQAELNRMHKTVNFYSFSEATWQVYAERLDAWVKADRLDQYYEAVLAELINEGSVTMHGADVGALGWAEVDDAKDLAELEGAIAARATAATTKE